MRHVLLPARFATLIDMSNTEVFSTRRLEALTDGVFAIAMTLLVLDLKVTDIGTINTNQQLWQYFVNNQTSYISFVISFLLLGSMWAVHTRQFEFIKRTDRHLTMINTLRLLSVVLIPLTTSIASDYSNILLGRILFPLNFFLLAVISYWQWNYATKRKSEFSEGMDAEDKKYANTRNQAIVSIALATLILSAFIGQLAFLLFVVTPFIARTTSKK